jgi:hypothetical protein
MADQGRVINPQRGSFSLGNNGLIIIIFLLILAGGAYLFVGPSKKTNTQTGQNKGTVPTPPKSAFLPSLDPKSQEGELVSDYSVLYTLSGHITIVKPSSDEGLYDITITSQTGSQTYEVLGVNGKGVLENSAGKELPFTELKPGDQVIMNISVSSAKSAAKAYVSQIKTVYK